MILMLTNHQTKGDKKMRQYPIWNKIKSCIYSSSKSYGVRKHSDCQVMVGTSSSNSHDFLEWKLTHYHDKEKKQRIYTFKVDGKIIKRAILKDGADNLDIWTSNFGQEQGLLEKET